jgi:hypothetical protein
MVLGVGRCCMISATAYMTKIYRFQGQQKLISDMFGAVRALDMKLKLFRKRFENINLCLVRFPAGAGNFSLHHCVQKGSGAHLASYPMGTRGSFPGRKAAGSWSWPLTSSAEVTNAWSYTSTPQYVFMSWCLVKHRDNFTFTFYLVFFSYDLMRKHGSLSKFPWCRNDCLSENFKTRFTDFHSYVTNVHTFGKVFSADVSNALEVVQFEFTELQYYSNFPGSFNQKALITIYASLAVSRFSELHVLSGQFSRYIW